MPKYAFLVPSDPQAREEALQMLQSLADRGSAWAKRIIYKAEADEDCKGILYVEVNDDAPLP